MESLETEVCNELEKRDGLGRRLLSKDQWAELLSAYDSSGMTQKGFCRHEGLNHSKRPSRIPCKGILSTRCPFGSHQLPARRMGGTAQAINCPEVNRRAAYTAQTAPQGPVSNGLRFTRSS